MSIHNGNALIELFLGNMDWDYVSGPDIEWGWKSPLHDSVLEEVKANFKMRFWECGQFFGPKL